MIELILFYLIDIVLNIIQTITIIALYLTVRKHSHKGDVIMDTSLPQETYELWAELVAKEDIKKDKEENDEQTRNV